MKRTPQRQSLGFEVSMMLVLAGALSACGGGHDPASSTDPGGATPSSTPASTPTPTAQASTSRLPGIEVSFAAVPAAAGSPDSGGAYDIRVDDPAAVESVSLLAADSSVLATVAAASRSPYRLGSGNASRPAFVSLLLKDGNVVETPVAAP